MIIFSWTIALITLLGVLAYLRFSILAATICTFIMLVIGHTLMIVTPLGWSIFIILAAIINIPIIRIQGISRPAFIIYKKIMPEISTTEQTAIDAGSIWWEAELFAGNPDWSILHNYPKPKLSEEEKAFLSGPVETLCAMLNEFEITHKIADLPPQVWDYIKKEKFFAMIISKKYGGLEFSAYTQSLVLQKIASISSVAASTIGVPNSLGPGELLLHYGTQEQKEYYLPRLAQGEEIPCFALTSPEAGSDAGAIPDQGIVCYDTWEGKKTLGMRLTWNKRYITLAPIATLLGLAFKLKDPDKLLGDKENLGITCALIPTHIKGVVTGRRHLPLNCTFQNGPTTGQDIFLPLSFIIGGKDMAGQGWRMLMECLSVGRGITLPSNAAGGILSAAVSTGAYARIRRQFKIPIGTQEGIEEPLARLGANAYLVQAAGDLTTTAIDLGQKPAIISAIVKYNLTDRLQKCLIDAMDVHGGKGICLGPKNYIGRGYQSAPIAITVEGANILTRSMIIYGQGAIRCHPYLLDEMKSIQIEDQVKALQTFDKAIWGHVGFYLSNAVKSFALGLVRSRFSRSPYRDFTKRYYQKMNRLSANLAFLSDTYMVLFGGQLKRKEKISARLGDILSQLYLASSILKKYQDEGRQEEAKPLVQWAVEDCIYQAELAILGLLHNLSPRPLAYLTRFILYPTGYSLRPPRDKIDHQIAQLLQTPCSARDQFKMHLYMTPTPNNAIGLQEEALKAILAVEPLHKKICDATQKRFSFMFLDKVAKQGKDMGAITDAEYQQMVAAEKHRLDTINVDDFDDKELKIKTSR